MKHTLIVPYRNKPTALPIWFKAVEAQDRANWQVILVELSNAPTRDLPDWIDHLWLDHPGTFSRAKALNAGVSRSAGDYITIVDIDCMMQPGHFQKIEAFYAIPENAQIKMSTRVRLLDKNTTYMALNKSDPYAHLLAKVFPDTERHQQLLLEEKIDYGKLLGNSHITISRDQYRELGGFDERYVGWGAEDTEFNSRFWKHYGTETVMAGGEMFHLWHERGQPDYDSDAIIQANRARYHATQAAGFPLLKRA